MRSQFTWLAISCSLIVVLILLIIRKPETNWTAVSVLVGFVIFMLNKTDEQTRDRERIRRETLVEHERYTREKQTEHHRYTRDRKSPIYDELQGFLFDIAFSSKTGKKFGSAEMIQFKCLISPKLISWGSPDVIEAYNKLTEESLLKDDVRTMSNLADVLVAIRRELGGPDDSLSWEEIFKLFVIDGGDYFKKVRAFRNENELSQCRTFETSETN